MASTSCYGRPLTSGEKALVSNDTPSLSMPDSPFYSISDLNLPSNFVLVVKDKSNERRRGRTTLRNSIANLKDGKKYEILLNENGVAIKGEVKKFAYYIGMEARTIPCTYDTWKDVPLELKEELYEHVKEKFSFGGKECFERVIHIANTAWRREKMLIREKVVNGQSLTDALANIPLGYNKEDWEKICIQWLSTEYGAMCEQRKNARLQVKLKHSMGSDSLDYFLANNEDKEGEALFREMYTSKKTKKLIDAGKVILESIDLEMKNLSQTMSEGEHARARNNAFRRVINNDGTKKKTRKRCGSESGSPLNFETAVKEMEKRWGVEKESLLQQLKEKDEDMLAYREKAEKEMLEYKEKTNNRFKVLEHSILSLGV